jgi:hypothetical protein
MLAELRSLFWLAWYLINSARVLRSDMACARVESFRVKTRFEMTGGE